MSKQAVNPGPNFGPYGLPKAATLFLVRQYAVDYGADGIRANAVNADRIRSGLLTDDFIKERSKARGVSEKDYMSGNLLGREVTADDVAQAFLHQALELKTTGDVTTVDGGNIAAALAIAEITLSPPAHCRPPGAPLDSAGANGGIHVRSRRTRRPADHRADRQLHRQRRRRDIQLHRRPRFDRGQDRRHASIRTR